MCFTVDPDEHLIQVPSPGRIRSLLNTTLSDLRSEQRTKPVPPETHGFVADIDPAFEQQIFDLPQRERIANVHHHREADDLGRTVEIAERIAHRGKLRIAPAPLKPVYSDNAGFPLVERPFVDAVLAAHIDLSLARLLFFQDRDDLFLGKPRTLHLPVSLSSDEHYISVAETQGLTSKKRLTICCSRKSGDFADSDG